MRKHSLILWYRKLYSRYHCEILHLVQDRPSPSLKAEDENRRRLSPQAIFLAVLLCIVAAGCAPRAPEKDVVAKINNYEITKDKFEAEFKDSIYGQVDTPEAREEFLNNLIERKLILQDAQRKGLDKQPEFLKRIEKFWEQSLLKVALDQKTGEPQTLKEWITQLHKKAQIEINYELLQQK